MSSVISFDHVHFSFGLEDVLKDVSAQIKEHEFIAIIGPNGGGKTTFLKLAMGFLSPTSGKISLFGDSPEKKRHLIGYVPQNSLFDRSFPISVIEIVLSSMARASGWFGRYPKEIKERAYYLLNELGLYEERDKAFGDLSGGKAQRALIARALIDDPPILLLDEPASNIDPHAKKALYELIYSFKGKKTVMMVTHDLNSAIGSVDRLICIEKELTSLEPKEVCEHYALGLYHTPLSDK